MRAIDRVAHTNRWRAVPAAEKALVCALALTVALAAAGWAGLAFVFLLMLGLLHFGAGVRMGEIARAASAPAGFIALGTLAQMATVDLSRGWPVLGLVDMAGIQQAAFVAARSLACVSALLFLALTTPLTSLLQMARRAGLDRDIADIILIMVRIVWLMLGYMETTQRAQAARLGNGGWRRTLKAKGQLLATLLPRVLAQADRMSLGLAARGYTGDLAFLSLEQETSRGRLAALGGAGLVVGLICLRLP